MPKRTAKEGWEYLLLSAESGVVDGVGGPEIGSAFAALVMNGGLLPAVGDKGSDLVDVERVAQRGLTVAEVHAMSGVMAAYSVAMNERNPEAAEDVVRLGLILMARWPDFLRFITSGESESER